MEEFTDYLHKKTGLNLSNKELLKLYIHYYDETLNKVNYDKLMNDLKHNIQDQKEVNAAGYDEIAMHKTKLKKTDLDYSQLIQIIYDHIQSKIINLTGKDHLKKVYLLLSESRSSVVTRSQLKAACHSRLCLFLKDADIEVIFNKLDLNCTGTVNIRLLISEIMKKENIHDVSLTVGINYRAPKVKVTFDQNENENARITYDNKYLNLNEPNPDRCVKHSIIDIERIIRTKIIERCTASDNMAKTALKLFSDGSHQQGDPKITLDHIKYTLWKKLRLNITSFDIIQFYNKYDKTNVGFIYMSALMNGIIKQLDISEPLMEDKAYLSKSDRILVDKKIHQNDDLEVFFTLLRSHINDMINRESRAPHYILHGTTKMTLPQAKLFFKHKLYFDLDSMISPEVRNTILTKYTIDGLVQVKTIILEALSMKNVKEMENLSTLYGSLLNGSLVSVDRMPSSLKQAKLSPADIEQLIRSKCNERLKNDHPHASLHKMLRDNDSIDARVITRSGMNKILRLFDIIMDQDDFERFFLKHDRGDGVIDVHQLIKVLLPPDNLSDNPLIPKDPKDAYAESQLSNALRNITGKQRRVTLLNGIGSNRLVDGLLDDLTGNPSSNNSTIQPSNNDYINDIDMNNTRRPSTANDISSTGKGNVFFDTTRPQSNQITVPPSSKEGLLGGILEPSVIDHASHSQTYMNNDLNNTISKPSVPKVFIVTNSLKRPQSAPTSAAMKVSSSGRTVLQQQQQQPPVNSRANTHFSALMQGSLLNAINDLTLEQEVPQSNNNQDEELEQSTTNETSATSALARYRSQQSSLLRELANAYDAQNQSAMYEAATNSTTINQLNNNNSLHLSSVSPRSSPRPSSAPTTTSYHRTTTTTNIALPPSNHDTPSKGSYPRKGTFLNVVEPAANTLVSTNMDATNPNFNLDTLIINKYGNTAPHNMFSTLSPRPNTSNDATTNYSPRSRISMDTTSSTNNTSPRSYRLLTTTVNGQTSPIKGSEASPRFVYTGQPRQCKVDPLSEVMKTKYQISRKHTKTSHEEYGLFVKNIAYTVKAKSKVFEKQKTSTLGQDRGGAISFY